MKTLLAPFLGFSLGLILLAPCGASILRADPPGPPAERVFRAGAATSNITPFIGAGIVGGWGVPPSTHIHDELLVRCLVLDDGKSQLAFAIVDSVSVNREVFDEAKRLIHQETGWPATHLMMSATHTHSGPSARGESAFDHNRPFDQYQTFLARRIADGVRRALNNLEPAQIGWGSGSVPQHLFNRRWHMKPGLKLTNPFGGEDKVLMNPGVADPNLLEPAGPTDPQVSFISVQSADGRPIALLANYSLHYVGGVPSDHISADYFAVFCDLIQELLGADRQNPPFVGLLTNGASGDVNNINFRGPRERRAPYEQIRLVARDVALEVHRIYQTVEHHHWVPLHAAQRELTLKTRHPTSDMLEWAKQIQARPDTVSPLHRHEKTYAQRAIQMAAWPEQISVPLQTFRIGGLGIAAIPFETFAETGLEIKMRSPMESTFVISLANGGYGYLPTPEQHELGGYETWLGTSRVEKEASRKIVSALLQLFH
jgi:neutral ceramidase